MDAIKGLSLLFGVLFSITSIGIGSGEAKGVLVTYNTTAFLSLFYLLYSSFKFKSVFFIILFFVGLVIFNPFYVFIYSTPLVKIICYLYFFSTLKFLFDIKVLSDFKSKKY